MTTQHLMPPESAGRQTSVDISVLVPVKDEAESLAQLVAEVREALDHTTGTRTSTWELILIDDGSADGSWDQICELGANDARVKGLRLRRNFGKSAALAAGIEVARGDVIATMDGDLQDDPNELPGMIERVGDGADLVTGHKVDRKDPLSKRVPSKLFNWATGLITGLRLKDHNCGLKVGRRSVFLSTPLYGEMHRYFAAISHAQGFEVVEQAVNHRPRVHGSSKFGFERYVRGGLDLLTVITLTRYHRRPLHLFGGLGLILGLLGVIILLYLSGVWFIFDQPIGNRPLLLLGALLVMVALQLASVGLLAELIANQGAKSEDTLRHVVATTNSPVRVNHLSPRSSLTTGEATDDGQEQVSGRVDYPQNDRDGGRLGHADQR